MQRSLLLALLAGIIAVVGAPSPVPSAPVSSASGPALMGDSLKLVEAEREVSAILRLSGRSACDSLDRYLIYTGADRSRRWKDTCRYADREERAAVDRLCRRIASYMRGGATYTFGRGIIERESEGEWVVIPVTFEAGDSKRMASFAMLNIGGRYRLGDID